MRMGPFSTEAVIEMLNQYFIPLQISTEDYLKRATKPAAERTYLRSLWRRADEKELARGTVHVYIVAPDGELFDSRHVRDATQVSSLLPWLRQIISSLQVERGRQLIPRKPRRSLPFEPSPDSLLIRIAAEYPDEPGTVGEDWIQLSPHEWRAFLPKSDQGSKAWNIDAALAKKILVHLYPFSQDWDVRHNTFSRCDLEARLISGDAARGVVAIRGYLRMQHNRYTDRRPEPVQAEIVGTIIFAPLSLPEWKLTTGEASYGGRAFDGLIISATDQEPPSQDR